MSRLFIHDEYADLVYVHKLRDVSMTFPFVESHLDFLDNSLNSYLVFCSDFNNRLGNSSLSRAQVSSEQIVDELKNKSGYKWKMYYSHNKHCLTMRVGEYYMFMDCIISCSESI